MSRLSCVCCARYLGTALITAAIALNLTACNTVAGIGQDIASVGDKMSQTAYEASQRNAQTAQPNLNQQPQNVQYDQYGQPIIYDQTNYGQTNYGQNNYSQSQQYAP